MTTPIDKAPPADDSKPLRQKTRQRAQIAGKKAVRAGGKTAKTAKEHPAATAAIATGAVAAIAGAIFGFLRFGRGKKPVGANTDPVPPKVTPSAD